MQNSERAININSLNGNDFPINIEFAKINEVYRIYLMPISVLEIIDLIPLNIFLVFKVDTNNFDGLKPTTLRTFAEKYSSFLTDFDEETLLMDKESIVQLLENISHYNFSLIDADREINIDEVIQIIDLSDKWNEKVVIDELSANVFLSSHDDCYLYLETNNENVALELIARQIKILIATITNCSLDELNFDPKELIFQNDFSIVIPQNPTINFNRNIWKIFDGTFKDFIYSKEMAESKYSLVYYETDNLIKIEKVRSDETSD
jgi:hypothetical protein